MEPTVSGRVKTGIIAAVIISSVLFSLVHVPENPGLFFAYFIIGTILCGIYITIMVLKYIKCSPSGNITVLVTSKVERKNYASIAKEIMTTDSNDWFQTMGGPMKKSKK